MWKIAVLFRDFPKSSYFLFKQLLPYIRSLLSLTSMDGEVI